MVKFFEVRAFVVPSDFKFINQRLVKVVFLMGCRLVCLQLSKSDVIDAINYYIDEIHLISKQPIRSEGMNYRAFKMHDLVPYLYSLLNLYLTRRDTVHGYRRYLPELKLSRFCHLPFEDEVLVQEKPLLSVKYAVLPVAGDDSKTKCVCVLPNRILSVSSLPCLESLVSMYFPMYRIYLYCDQPF